MGRILCGDLGRVASGGLAVVVGVPLVLLEVALLGGLTTAAPHLLNARDAAVVTRLAGPLCLLHLTSCVAVLLLALKPRCVAARIVLWVSLVLAGLGTFVLYHRREGLQRAACVHHCARQVLNITSVRSLDGERTPTGAFCLYTAPRPRHSGACYVHEPQLVRQFHNYGAWWNVALMVLVASVAINVVISSVSPPPVTYTTHGARILQGAP